MMVRRISKKSVGLTTAVKLKKKMSEVNEVRLASKQEDVSQVWKNAWTGCSAYLDNISQGSVGLGIGSLHLLPLLTQPQRQRLHSAQHHLLHTPTNSDCTPHTSNLILRCINIGSVICPHLPPDMQTSDA